MTSRALQPGRRKGLFEKSSADLQQSIASLRRYAQGLVGSPTEADDLVQETFRRVLMQSGGPAIRDHRNYAYRVLRNLARDMARREKLALTVLPFDGRLEETVGGAGGQTHHVALLELHRAIDGLALHQREVVLLVGLEGLSYGAAAEVLGVPIGTVMSRLNRGRGVLRQRLGLSSVRP